MRYRENIHTYFYIKNTQTRHGSHNFNPSREATATRAL